MSILEATVAGCTRIEQRLRDLGGDGSGISELLDSVSSRVPDDLARRLRAVAAVRNHFVHEHGYSYPGSEATFFAELERAVADLVALTEGPGDHAIPQVAVMSQSTKWVRVITEASTPKMFIYKWPSTGEERLVLFRGDTAEAMPLGKH